MVYRRSFAAIGLALAIDDHFVGAGKVAINLLMRLITGCKGTAAIRVAAESGEIGGLDSFSWVSVGI